MNGECTFKQPTNVRVTDKYFRLAEDYTYCWTAEGTQYRIVIPAGFTNDGASVPRFARMIIRPEGHIRAAALVHDWIYQHKGVLPPGSHQYKHADGTWKNVYGKWRRRDADRLFARIMREAGVSRFKRRTAYRFVRLLGWIAW